MFDLTQDQKPKLNFFKSTTGKVLNAFLTKPRSGLGLDWSEVDMKFAYPKVPKIKNDTYVEPTKEELLPFVNELQDYIRETQPSLVIGFGAVANLAIVFDKHKSMFANKRNISTFDVHEYKFGDFKTHVSFMPALTKAYNMSIPDKDKLVIERRLVKRFLKGGAKALEPQLGEYEYFTDYSDVENLFTNILPKQKMVACDFETNTLQTWLPGAKAIMFSCSWKEHQGVAIPLDHKDYPNLWTKEQHDQIFKWIVDLVSSKQYKVLHNSAFDIRMMMDIMGLQQARNCLDTLVMYYVAYTEEKQAQKGLKHLAYKYTDMGGYENDRDAYFDNMMKNRYDYWYKAETERLEKEAQEKGTKPKKPKKSDYKPPINEVDGTKTSFEWLPLKIIYPYAAADTDVTLQLLHQFTKKVDKNPKWQKLCYWWYPLLLDTLCYMEHTGLYIDLDKDKEYREAYHKIQDDLVDKMYSAVPEIQTFEKERLKQVAQRKQLMKETKPKDRTKEQLNFIKEAGKLMGTDGKGIPKFKFTPSSNNKVGYVLYNMLGYELPAEKEYLSPTAIRKKQLLSHPERITWEDYKTDAKNALPYLVETYDDTLSKYLMEYSKIEKIITGYVDALPDLACDNLIHTEFMATRTSTSRLASKSPKLKLGL